jgi:hypothetical protein
VKSFISEYNSALSAPKHTLTNLFRFDFAKTFRFTPFAQNILYDTFWWKSKAIQFDEARFNMNQQIDTLDLQFDNVDNWFSDLCLAESVTGSPVYLYQAALDNNLAVIATDLMMFGYADKRTFNQQKGTLTVKNHMAHWKRLSPSLHTASCRWVFKESASQVIGTDSANYTCIIDHPATAASRPTTGANYASFWIEAGAAGVTWVTGTDYKAATCRYAGVGTWCDQSWERCATLTNTLNFGGNRWLPYYEDKVIWWGRVPSKEGPR